jgi:hypothetical protein
MERPVGPQPFVVRPHSHALLRTHAGGVSCRGVAQVVAADGREVRRFPGIDLLVHEQRRQWQRQIGGAGREKVAQRVILLVVPMLGNVEEGLGAIAVETMRVEVGLLDLRPWHLKRIENPGAAQVGLEGFLDPPADRDSLLVDAQSFSRLI